MYTECTHSSENACKKSYWLFYCCSTWSIGLCYPKVNSSGIWRWTLLGSDAQEQSREQCPTALRWVISTQSSSQSKDINWQFPLQSSPQLLRGGSEWKQCHDGSLPELQHTSVSQGKAPSLSASQQQHCLVRIHTEYESTAPGSCKQHRPNTTPRLQGITAIWELELLPWLQCSRGTETHGDNSKKTGRPGVSLLTGAWAAWSPQCWQLNTIIEVTYNHHRTIWLLQSFIVVFLTNQRGNAFLTATGATPGKLLVCSSG